MLLFGVSYSHNYKEYYFYNYNDPNAPVIRVFHKFLELCIDLDHSRVVSFYVSINLSEHLVLNSNLLIKVLIFIPYALDYSRYFIKLSILIREQLLVLGYELLLIMIP